LKKRKKQNVVDLTNFLEYSCKSPQHETRQKPFLVRSKKWKTSGRVNNKFLLKLAIFVINKKDWLFNTRTDWQTC